MAPRADAALLAHLVGDGDGHRLEARERDVAQPLELAVVDEGARELDLPRRLRSRMHEVPLGSHEGLGTDDDLLADRVDGRVRDLGEELLEVVVQELGLVGEDGQGDVVAHGAYRVDPVADHGHEDEPLVLVGVAEGPLQAEHGLVVGLGMGGGGGEVLEPDHVLVEPLPVGMRAGRPLLDLVVVDDPTFLRVDEEHAARLEPLLAHDPIGWDVEDPHLGGEDHGVVEGDVIARGPESVAVEDGPHARPVGEGHRRGAVPGLDEGGVVLVEGLLRVAHRLVARPGLGDHHHHRVRERPAREVEEFEAVVEHGRVRPVRVDDRHDARGVGAEELGPNHRLAGVHPVHVAAQGVDLAVVDEVAVRVGAFPAREGVRAEARMHDAQGRLEGGMREVQVEGLHLLGDEHALVDDGLAGEAGEVEVVRRGLGLALGGLLGPLAHDVELALEGHVVQGPDRALRDEELADMGHDRARDVAERGHVDGEVAPAEAGEPLFEDDLLEAALDHGPGGGVAGEEHHADAVVAGGRQGDARLGADLGEEAVRDLRKHAGPVAGVALVAGAPAVAHVVEDRERLAHDLVGLPSLDVDHETDAAGVVLPRGIVQALSGRQAGGDLPALLVLTHHGSFFPTTSTCFIG